MAMKQFNNHYQNTIDKVGELGDTSNAVSRRAGENARSLKSALTGLQNAVLAQSDEALTRPIEKLAKLLNENPDGLKKAIKGVGIALGVLATMKALTTVMSFIGSLKGVQGGGGLDVSAAGGAGIPVHVTNWGGAAESSMISGMGNAGIPAPSNLLNNAVVAATVATAVYEIPQMFNKLEAIKQDETLTNKERGEAEGGAIGSATGAITGAGLGAFGGGLLAAIASSAIAGTALGTAVPELGNLVGLVIGAGVGAAGYYIGKKAGEAAGEAIGG
jgi:hypothetical protein